MREISRPVLWLASRSARRKELLREAGIPFRAVKSFFKEKNFPGGPRRTVVMNAIGKVKHARVRARQGWILGADTIVYLRKQVIGKPKTMRKAIRMLLSLSGTKHSVYTGLALFDIERKKWKTACVRSQVVMRTFGAETARAYVAKVNPLDKAGAYAIQEHGDRLIEKIDGSYSNVVGLPMEKLGSLLADILK